MGMIFAWLYVALKELFGDRFRDYFEPMLNRQHSRLQTRIGQLQASATKLDVLSSIHQHNTLHPKIRRRGKLLRKTERLTRKSAKLQEMMNFGNESSEKPAQPEQEFDGKWIKETDNDTTLLPPAYDEIFPQQPPAYDEVEGSKVGNLYPILTEV